MKQEKYSIILIINLLRLLEKIKQIIYGMVIAMLENKKKLDHENSPYHYVGKELGHDVYLVDIKENKTKKTEINLDDALLDSSDFSDEYYDC